MGSMMKQLIFLSILIMGGQAHSFSSSDAAIATDDYSGSFLYEVRPRTFNFVMRYAQQLAEKILKDKMSYAVMSHLWESITTILHDSGKIVIMENGTRKTLFDFVVQNMSDSEKFYLLGAVHGSIATIQRELRKAQEMRDAEERARQPLDRV